MKMKTMRFAKAETTVDCHYLKRMACMPHTEQLIVNQMSKCAAVRPILDSARRMVEKFRKSSIATQKLVLKSNKTVITDCPTRWSSTFLLLQRLIELKVSVNAIAEEMGWDILLSSEWLKTDQLLKLLQPFAEHTRLLEGDKVVMLSVIPALMDIEYHLLEAQSNQALDASLKGLALTFLDGLTRRFEFALEPEVDIFEPIPSAACLLDPTTVSAMFITGKEYLLNAAKQFVLREGAASAAAAAVNTLLGQVTSAAGQPSLNQNITATASPDSAGSTVLATSGPPLKRFKSLTQHIANTTPVTNIIAAVRGPEDELEDYLLHCQETATAVNEDDIGLSYWQSQNVQKTFPLLAPLALGILKAPVSEAYVERIVSLCGDLTTGKRNRANQSLEKRVFLKLNSHLF